MTIQHQRDDGGKRVVWMSEEGKEKTFILVMIAGGKMLVPDQADYSHLGFALESQEAVDEIAKRAKSEGCLIWSPQNNPYPVGYYCGLRDPQGNAVEFSYGQPLGPGAE
jgi:predicted enzyme related to lactoylglutathione lyase